MKRMLAGCACLLLLSASVANADEAPIRPKPQPGKLTVMVDANAKSPRLIVPKQMLNDQRRGDAGLLPTIMAGLALALAFAGSGLWVARQRRGATLAVVAGLSLLALGTALWADSAGPLPPLKVASFDDTSVIVVEKADGIQLVISPADLAKLNGVKNK